MTPSPLTDLSAARELCEIKLLSCDVDGVLTDGGLYYDHYGHELRRFHVHDGLGMQALEAAGIRICIVTRSGTPAIQHRARHLGVSYCHTGVHDKRTCVAEIADTLAIPMEAVAHVGDDVNDLDLLKVVGVPIAVADAVTEVRENCRFVTNASGGSGAMREIAEAILRSHNQRVTA
jgi:3-deoxy-D-manno-octulosonate 8-phosphate phosphatase (KDO 8-P phosphatase)